MLIITFSNGYQFTVKENDLINRSLDSIYKEIMIHAGFVHIDCLEPDGIKQRAFQLNTAHIVTAELKE